jgi:predicted Zn finger-like uncharacterized protein
MAETMEDLEPLVTRCPECGTRFRVSEAQLQMAGGRVRCGSCLTVFFGTDHLQWDLEQLATTADPGAALDELLKEIDVFEATDGVRADEALSPPERVTEEDELAENAREALLETLVETPPQIAPAVPRPEDPEEPEVIAAAAVEPLVNWATVAVPAAESPPVIDPQLTDHGGSPSDRFVSLFDDPPEASTVEAPQDESAAPPADSTTVAASPVDVATPAEPPPPASRPVEPARIRRKRTARRPVSASRAEAIQAVAPTNTPVIEAPEPEAPEPDALPRRRGVRWMLLLPVGVILIAAQVMVYFFPAWSADPEMRWVPEQVCAIGGCELEPLKVLDQLLITDVVIRAHPEDVSLRLVNVLLVNTASFEQAFPDVEIAFRAPTNDLVAWKRVPASEYLSASLARRPVIPGKTPVRIEFTIEDPGTQSYGYEISLK